MGKKKRQTVTTEEQKANSPVVLIDRRSAVRISDVVEEKIKQLLQNATIAEVWSRKTETHLSERKAASRLLVMYKSLLDYGFSDNQIEQAIRELPKRCVSLDVALDWLMLNISVDALPKCFTDHNAVFSTKNIIDVIKTTNPRSRVEEYGETNAPQIQETEPRALLKKKSGTLPVADDRDDVSKCAEDHQETVGNSKNWIMQYMTELSDEDSPESVKMEENEETKLDTQWLVWSDDREVERRRQERRDRTDVAQLLNELVSELKTVKKAAEEAKTARDREKQRQTGLMIQSLKKELGELEAANGLPIGRTFAAEQSKPAAKNKDPSPEIESVIDSCHLFIEEETVLPESCRLPESTDMTDDGKQGKTIDETRQTVEKGEDSDAEFVGGLFDDGGEWEEENGTASFFDQQPDAKLVIPTAQTVVLTPEGKEISLALEGSRKSHPPIKTDPQRMPKYLLSQNCQKQKWSHPSYNKIPGSQYLHSVSVTVKEQKKRAAVAIENGCHRIVMPLEYRPGSVQEAQNCVAVAALMKLFPNLNLDFVFQQPYREIHRQLKQQRVELENVEDDYVERFIEEIVKNGEFQKKDEDGVDQRQISKDASEIYKGKESTAQRFLRRHSKTDARLKSDFLEFRSSSNGEQWLTERSALPVCTIRDRVIESLGQQASIVVMGDTGCGKTTQIPQYIYEHAVLADAGSLCNILVTQPRRLAAVSVAIRVAEEMGQPSPVSQRGNRNTRSNQAQKRSAGLVGYHVRLDAAVGKATRLTFCTTGILLRLLSGDPLLSNVSHVVVDEVHERTMQTDFLLAVLRDLLDIRMHLGHPLKVVLMSATMDAVLFSQYMGCPQLFTSGRTFPVHVSYLEHIYERLQYKYRQQTIYRSLFDGKGVDVVVRIDPEDHLSEQSYGTRSERRLIDRNWGDDNTCAGHVLNKNYNEEYYPDLPPVAKRSLQIVNEERIDYDLLEQLVVDIDSKEEDGAMLVFLPGMYEINNLYDRLTGMRQFDQDWIIRLHASLTPEEQSRAFLVPPLRSAKTSKSSRTTLADYFDKEIASKTEECSLSSNDPTQRRLRKVVIATNIAETSLTIRDVVYVIDSGKLRERQFDPARGISSLAEEWISQASANQRKGRAGRVQEGRAFRLFTQYRFESKMRQFQVPEIMRMPLEEIILQIHAQKLGQSGNFLSKLPQPPGSIAIEAAVRNLTQIGAFEAGVEMLTPLGQILSTLPIDARIGKLLVYASYFGCLPAALTLAAAMGERSIFVTHPDSQAQLLQVKRRYAAAGSGTVATGQQSDHLIVIAAFHGWLENQRKRNRSEARRYVSENLLHEPTLLIIRDLRSQFAEILTQANLTIHTDNIWDLRSDNASLIRALLSASMYPNVCTLEAPEVGTSRNSPYWSDGRNKVELHKSSVNAELKPTDFHYPYIVYLEKVRTHGLIVRDCTVVSPISLLLFSGSLHVRHKDNVIVIDDRIRIRAGAPVAVLFKKLRIALDDLILKKINNPEAHLEAEDQMLDIIKTMLVEEEHARKKR